METEEAQGPRAQKSLKNGNRRLRSGICNQHSQHPFIASANIPRGHQVSTKRPRSIGGGLNNPVYPPYISGSMSILVRSPFGRRRDHRSKEITMRSASSGTRQFRLKRSEEHTSELQ